MFIYEGGDDPGRSWFVGSLLLTGADVPQVLHWLRESLPIDSCWSQAWCGTPSIRRLNPASGSTGYFAMTS